MMGKSSESVKTKWPAGNGSGKDLMRVEKEMRSSCQARNKGDGEDRSREVTHGICGVIEGKETEEMETASYTNFKAW